MFNRMCQCREWFARVMCSWRPWLAIRWAAVLIGGFSGFEALYVDRGWRYQAWRSCLHRSVSGPIIAHTDLIFWPCFSDKADCTSDMANWFGKLRTAASDSARGYWDRLVLLISSLFLQVPPQSCLDLALSRCWADFCHGFNFVYSTGRQCCLHWM